MTAFDLSDFVIIAHSAAAAVALSYAADHDGIAAIVLVDPATDPRVMLSDLREGFVHDMAGPDSAVAFQKYVASIAGDDTDVRSQVLADAALVGPTARAGLAAAVAAWNPEFALDAYLGPMLILSTPATDIDSRCIGCGPIFPISLFKPKAIGCNWIIRKSSPMRSWRLSERLHNRPPPFDRHPRFG